MMSHLFLNYFRVQQPVQTMGTSNTQRNKNVYFVESHTVNVGEEKSACSGQKIKINRGFKMTMKWFRTEMIKLSQKRKLIL